MHKYLSKITSTLTALVLVGSNFLPAVSFAANEIATKSEEQDILFDATINNGYSCVANIDEKLTLDINLAIENQGYIKDGTITIENNNYKIDESEINIENNVIKIGQVNNDKPVNYSIPLEFEKNDLISADYFEKDSTVKLDATYINEKGNEEKISKTIKEHLKWDTDVETSIRQELTRYLKYGNKTLLSFKISSGVKDNKFPISEKTIQMLVPTIEGQEPEKIIVSGDKFNYTYQNQVIVLNKKYVQDNKLIWNSNDECLVTYIYDTNASQTDIETLSVMEVKTATGKSIEARINNHTYHVQDTIGNLVDINIVGDNDVNKGYMYTNLNRTENKLETHYSSGYQVNIGLAEFVDQIQIKEDASNYLTLNRKIMVDKDELIKMLGEEGTIKILDSNDTELGILNKDNLQLDVNQYGLKYITSKPVQEGNLNIKLEKVVNPNLTYTKESLTGVTSIENSINATVLFQEQEILNNNVKKDINLIEPESKATININKENLSTIVKNENVVITATLEKNDISDALYTDPEILITLPNQISEVTLKDAKLIYEEELKPLEFKMVGKQIYLKLQGTQTQYSNIPNANGAIVRIVADITLNNLAVSANENVVLQYNNPARKELKSVQTPINIIAPTGFVTANAGALSQTVTAIGEDATMQIAANDVEKKIKLGGTIVSNLQEATSGLIILGRVPAQDTLLTNSSNENTQSTFSTTLANAISVNGIDADIYYSTNGSATYDLSNSNNAWTTQLSENVKSYMIVAKSDITPAQMVSFNYDINVPRNIDYENQAISTYSVYYDNKSENGISKNVVMAKSLIIATENIPVIRTTITAEDYYNNESINNGDKVNAGKLVRYTIHATNTGKKAAENVTVKIDKQDDNSNTAFQIYKVEENEQNNHYESSYESRLIEKIDKIEQGETKDIQFIVRINSWANVDDVYTIRTEISAENMLENSTASFENTVTEGTLTVRLNDMLGWKEIPLDQEINYYVTLENNKNETLNNVTVKVNIPKYLEIISSEGGSFDENSRILTYNIESLDDYQSFTLIAKATYSDEPNQKIELSATATFDEMEKEIKSNTDVKTIMDTKGFSATLSSNISDKMLDTDKIEYYIQVKNDSKKTANINVTDELPSELRLINYTVKNGTVGYTQEDPAMVLVTEAVNPGETLRITVVAEPYILDENEQIKETTNNAYVTVNGLKLDINTLSHQIENTLNYNGEMVDENGEMIENINSISGKVWYDKNANSKQDENEVGLPKVLVSLYDVTTKSIVKDKNGKNLEIYTNDNGQYKFENIAKGQYIVQVNYDNELYDISNYQVNDLLQNEDSDFIESNGKASTNIITIDEANQYNIDLGLIDKENFNITLKETISKVSVINGHETKVYDFNTENALLKLRKKENATLVIEYVIQLTNEGNVEGYVTNIANYIPKGTKFISELNSDWYIDSNGDAINTSIANEKLQPRESKKIKLILVKDITLEDTDLIHSTAEIRETYNQYGAITTVENLAKINAKVADIVVKDNTSQLVIQIATISLSIIAIIGLAGYEIYKFINR